MNGTLNKVMLIGHLGSEVKMHYFGEGNSIGRFSLATNDGYTDKEGKHISIAEWHHIVVRNKLAEICEKYLTKGDKIYCEGRIKTRKWTDEAGRDRTTTEIHVSELTFLSNKKSEKKSEQDKPNKTIDKKSTPPQNKDNDLPF
jgi:single-strand DNA-binding protein